MSYTLEQVTQALKKAHEAGDTESAKKLADEVRRMRQQPEPQQAGVMDYVNRGISQALGAPADLIGGGLSLVSGGRIGQDPFGGSASIQRGMEKTGIMSPDVGEPETFPQNIASGVGEATGFMVPAAGATKLLSKGPGLVSRISKEITESIARNPVVSTASEIGGGAGVGFGRHKAEQEHPDSPLARTGYELLGGIAGSLMPLAAIHAPSAKIANLTRKTVNKFSAPFSDKGAKFRAGEFVKKLVSDPQDTADAITMPTIGDLPPAVVSGEKRLVALYKDILSKDPLAESKAIMDLSASANVLETELRKLGYGSPDIFRDITVRRVAAIEANIDQRVLKAVGKAQKRLDAIPVAKRQDAEAMVVRQELEAVRGVEQNKVRQIWNEVPKEHPVGIKTAKSKFEELIGDLSVAQAVDIPVSLRRNNVLFGENEVVPFKELQGLRSKLLEEARIASSKGKKNTARIAYEVAEAILDDIGITAGAATTPEAAKLQAGLAATKQFKDRFEKGIVADILGVERTGAPSVDPSLTLDVSIGRMGRKGAVDIDKVVVTPQAKAATERYLARSFTDYATNKKTGELNPIKANDWVKKNEPILDTFPELRQQLTDASSAQKVADVTRATMAARRQRLRDPNMSVSARFLNTDVGNEVKSVLRAERPGQVAAQLARQARKDTTGASINGLRAGFIENMLDSAQYGSHNAAGERTLSGNMILNYLTSNRVALKEVFTGEQLARIRKIGTELSRLEMFEKSALKAPDFAVEDGVSNMLRLGSRVFGAQLGRKVATATGGGTVQTPGIFSERFRAFTGRLTRDKANQMLNDAILSKDGKLLEALLLPMDKPTANTTRNMKILDARINSWLAGPGRRVWEDIENEMFEEQQEGAE